MQDGVRFDEAQYHREVTPEPYSHVAHLLSQGTGVGYCDAVFSALEPSLQGVPASPVWLVDAPVRKRSEHPASLLASIRDRKGEVASLICQAAPPTAGSAFVIRRRSSSSAFRSSL